MQLASEKGIDKISVKEISKNCGVTTQTFYNHFSDKYELVMWTYKYRIDSLFECKSENVEWEELVYRYIHELALDVRFVLNAIRNMKGTDSYIKLAADYLAEKIVENHKKLKNLEEVPVDYVFQTKLYCYGFTNMIALWLENGMDVSEEELVGLVKRSLPPVFNYHSN